MQVYLCDGGVLLLPVLQRLLQMLLPQSLNCSDLEFVVGQQLTELLWKECRKNVRFTVFHNERNERFGKKKERVLYLCDHVGNVVYIERSFD